MANGKRAGGQTQQNPQDIHRKLVDQVHNMGKEFLTQWSVQMGNATRDASAPPEESRRNWWVALAGNLLWAASCFVPGAGVVKTAASAAARGMTQYGKVMYVAMSHGGAMVGAGVLATGPSGDLSGKDVITRELNKKLKELQAALHQHAEEWATSIERQPELTKLLSSGTEEDLLEFVDKSLWESMFPSIPYQDYNVVYNGALEKLNKSLADFNRQYQTWEKERRAYLAQSAGIPGAGRVRTWEYGVPHDHYVRYKDPGPFIPHLVFGVPGEQASPHPQVSPLPTGQVLRWKGNRYVVEPK